MQHILDTFLKCALSERRLPPPARVQNQAQEKGKQQDLEINHCLQESAVALQERTGKPCVFFFFFLILHYTKAGHLNLEL